LYVSLFWIYSIVFYMYGTIKIIIGEKNSKKKI
jgi:hypothetical protein